MATKVSNGMDFSKKIHLIFQDYFTNTELFSPPLEEVCNVHYAWEPPVWVFQLEKSTHSNVFFHNLILISIGL